MLRPITAQAAVLLLAAGADAAVQERRTVGWLGMGEWLLWEGKGYAYFVDSPSSKAVEKGRRWSVSAPTITAGSGKRIGYDAKGRDPKVRLVSDKEKAFSTRWAFEIVGRISPGASKEEPRMKEGHSGITFRAMAAEGPYKGWYLAAKDDGTGRQRLTLVRAKKDSTVFKYVETYYFVDHR